MTFLFFENNDDVYNKYRDAMKEQAFNVCRERINPKFIRTVFENFHFGWVRVSQKAEIGQRKRKHQIEYRVHSFVLCRRSTKLVHIDLICGRETSKGDGRLLIDIVESYASRIKAVAVEIYGALDVLTPYYDNLGYEKGSMLMGKDDVSYIMTKFIDYNNSSDDDDSDTDSDYDNNNNEYDINDTTDSKRQRI